MDLLASSSSFSSSRACVILAMSWLTCIAPAVTAFSSHSSMSPSAPPLLSVQDFKTSIRGQRGLVLDIDETLSWTVGFWMERMQKLFGNPEKLSVKDMADKYHLTQNVPYWQTEEAHAWMQVCPVLCLPPSSSLLPPPSSLLPPPFSMRDEPEAQEELPVIDGAVEGVAALQEAGVRLLGYLTVRPQSVVPSTRKWLLAQGLPDLPVVAKPDDVRRRRVIGGSREG
eukprot:754700-Hanusia_phi.AAC.2